MSKSQITDEAVFGDHTMITNPLLEEKYRVQRELAEEAGGDIQKYMENIDRIVGEAEEEYGVKFKYLDSDRAKPEKAKNG